MTHHRVKSAASTEEVQTDDLRGQNSTQKFEDF